MYNKANSIDSKGALCQINTKLKSFNKFNFSINEIHHTNMHGISIHNIIK